MPHQRVENVLHYADGEIWWEPKAVRIDSYEDMVLKSALAILESVDDVDMWGSPIHEPDECVECDALRLLDETAIRLHDDVSLDDIRGALAAD